MKRLCLPLLLMACRLYGQVPGKTDLRDSIPVIRPDMRAVVPMPTTLPNNAFYRNSKDPGSVVRATLDNMPIHGYDTTARRTPAIRYTKPKR